jgi:hypothetical protein
VVCGGTTANIISRLLRRDIRMDLSEYDSEMLLASDIVPFAVGARINQAHHPNTPVELDLRRNFVNKIASLLEQRFLKEVHIQYR